MYVDRRRGNRINFSKEPKLKNFQLMRSRKARSIRNWHWMILVSESIVVVPFQSHSHLNFFHYSLPSCPKINFPHVNSGVPEFVARLYRPCGLCDGNICQHEFDLNSHRIVHNNHIAVNSRKFNRLLFNWSGRASCIVRVLLVGRFTGVRPVRRLPLFLGKQCGIWMGTHCEHIVHNICVQFGHGSGAVHRNDRTISAKCMQSCSYFTLHRHRFIHDFHRFNTTASPLTSHCCGPLDFSFVKHTHGWKPTSVYLVGLHSLRWPVCAMHCSAYSYCPKRKVNRTKRSCNCWIED